MVEREVKNKKVWGVLDSGFKIKENVKAQNGSLGVNVNRVGFLRRLKMVNS